MNNNELDNQDKLNLREQNLQYLNKIRERKNILNDEDPISVDSYNKQEFGNIVNTEAEFKKSEREVIIKTPKETKKIGFLIGAFMGMFAFFIVSGVVALVAINALKSSSDTSTDYGIEQVKEVDKTLTNSNISTLSDLIYDQDSNTNLLIDIVEKITPAVVNVNMMASSGRDTIFGDNYMAGSGTGIIFDEDKDNIYIVTNYHVVSGATQVTVQLEGIDEEIPAKAVGKEADADIAVISISKSDVNKLGVDNISKVTFGDSDKLKVGELVLAIGNALGEGNTATLGIISAKDRVIDIDNLSLNVLQTDAAINNGNSGGPLINMNGEVIGINTAKVNDARVEGMGYSIASNDVEEIIEEIMNSDPSPFLGIAGYNITDEIAKAYGLPSIGVFVKEVVENSPAHKGGIKVNDIITSINGETVYDFNSLSEILKKIQVGKTIEVKVMRDGTKVSTLRITLDEILNNQF